MKNKLSNWISSLRGKLRRALTSDKRDDLQKMLDESW